MFPLKEIVIKNNHWSLTNVIGRLGKQDSLLAFVKNESWNEMYLIVQGNRLQHFVNGVLMSDVTDNDIINRRFNGILGVQVHVGPPMKIEYKDIKIKKL